MKNIKTILEKVYTTPELRKKIVPLFLGNPGLGKTVMIEEFAKEKGVNLVELITSQMSPFEISGIAMPDKENQKMTYYNFDKLANLKDGDILFFDELLNGNPTVLNACLTVLEQRKMISGQPLPDIMIVAAANPQGMVPLTPQIKERFMWYDVKFDSRIWINYMIKKYGITKTIGNKLSNLIKNEEFTGYNFMTPRSIDKAVSMMIHETPTPYSKDLKMILEEIVNNSTEHEIKLSEKNVLAPGESMTWLRLIQYKFNVNSKELESKKSSILPKKWAIHGGNLDTAQWKKVLEYVNANGAQPPYDRDNTSFYHFPVYSYNEVLCTTSSTLEKGYTEIHFNMFKQEVYDPWIKSLES